MDGDLRSDGRSLKPDKTAKIRAGVEYRVPVSPTITEWILLPDLRERLAHQLNSLVGPLIHQLVESSGSECQIVNTS